MERDYSKSLLVRKVFKRNCHSSGIAVGALYLKHYVELHDVMFIKVSKVINVVG